MLYKNKDKPSASNDGALLWGTASGVTLLLVLTVIMLTLSPPTSRSLDDSVGRLATGWSAAVATEDAGLLDDSGRSDDARRSDDMGFSTTSDDDGGFVSTGDTSVLTDSCTGREGGLAVGRGGVVLSSAVCLATVQTQQQLCSIYTDRAVLYSHWWCNSKQGWAQWRPINS